MKVLFQIRPDYLKNPAGDTVQMISTGQGLKNLGLEISISTDPNQLLTSFDLVHIFNITRIKESYLFFLNAQKQQKKDSHITCLLEPKCLFAGTARTGKPAIIAQRRKRNGQPQTRFLQNRSLLRHP